MGRLVFLCGCEIGEIVDEANLATMSMVSVDDEGMLICTIHRQRRYGWRPTINDYPKTPQQLEAEVVYGRT